MAEENSSVAPAGDATSTGAQGTEAQSTGAPPTGTQAPAATGGAGESMSPQQAEARIAELKADPAYRKMLLGQENQIGTRDAQAEWDRLHAIAHGNQAQQRQAEQPQEYMINSDVVGKNSPLIGWMRGLGADQGIVDGAVHMAERLIDSLPSREQIEAQGAEAVDNLTRKYGEDGAQEKIAAARSVIARLPTEQRAEFELFLDVTGLGSHPWMVERLALLGERLN